MDNYLSHPVQQAVFAESRKSVNATHDASNRAREVS
jgi:hypothetical protein